MATLLLAVSAYAQYDSGPPAGAQRYIVILDNEPDSLRAACDLAYALNKDVTHVYKHAVRGFSAELTPDTLELLRAHKRVRLIEPDFELQAADQTLPTGIDRIDTELNVIADIDGVDERVDIDVAVVDTGIDVDHMDLNVVGGVRFYSNGSQDDRYDDEHGHGTHVAGIVGAIDNDIGVVGVAPGARLWAVRVLDSSGDGMVSDLIAGIDWITARADTIEVANMSLQGQGTSAALRQALQNSVAAGVVYFAAAGNDYTNIYGSDGTFGTSDDFLPAAYPEVAAISALADSDGQPGGLGGSTSHGPDDSFASLSNYSTSVVAGNPVTSPGAAIDLMMPGIGIYSTDRNGTYSTRYGTSMASAHASGLAALYIASAGTRDFTGDGTIDENDVYLIRQSMIDDGVPQTDPEGLDMLNDPDNNPERVGFAERDLPTETVSTPDAPTGPDTASIGEVVSFSTGGAESNLGHSVEYQLDWDDGSYSGWSATGTASHAWNLDGEYMVRARARCATHTSVLSDWSEGANITIAIVVSDSPPDAPSGLNATGLSQPQIRLTWVDNSQNELGFTIERKYRGAGYFHEIGRVGTDVISYDDTAIVVGTEYTYRVKAWNYVDEGFGPVETYSPPSNEATAYVSGGGGGGCFIASSAYGSYLDDSVKALRLYRDRGLTADPVGRAFVTTYYSMTPAVAHFIDEHPSLRPAVRAALLPAVAVSETAESAGMPLGSAAVAFVGLAPLAVLLFAARKRLSRDVR